MNMEKLREKSLRYIIGWVFFLIIGMVGVSFQMYQFVTGNLEINRNQLLITFLCTLFVFRPMGLVDIIEVLFKGLASKITK